MVPFFISTKIAIYILEFIFYGIELILGDDAIHLKTLF